MTRGEQTVGAALMLGRRLTALVLLAVLLGGCPLHVIQEPPLEMPPRPAIQFSLCGDRVCLSQADADQLLKYLDKLDAFAAARTRLTQ